MSNDLFTSFCGTSSTSTSRFDADVNHGLARELVERAERSGRGIAKEELTGIRERIQVRKAQRGQPSAWAFDDWGQELAYKAGLFGDAGDRRGSPQVITTMPRVRALREGESAITGAI